MTYFRDCPEVADDVPRDIRINVFSLRVIWIFICNGIYMCYISDRSRRVTYIYIDTSSRRVTCVHPSPNAIVAASQALVSFIRPF
jgi:hypothetical protein